MLNSFLTGACHFQRKIFGGGWTVVKKWFFFDNNGAFSETVVLPDGIEMSLSVVKKPSVCLSFCLLDSFPPSCRKHIGRQADGFLFCGDWPSLELSQAVNSINSIFCNPISEIFDGIFQEARVGILGARGIFRLCIF